MVDQTLPDPALVVQTQAANDNRQGYVYVLLSYVISVVHH